MHIVCTLYTHFICYILLRVIGAPKTGDDFVIAIILCENFAAHNIIYPQFKEFSMYTRKFWEYLITTHQALHAS